jgi:DNA-binding NtrC family response regulator
MAPIDGETMQPAGPESGGETILLVEDEPLIRELSRDMLERQGYRVVLASDAKEAERMSAKAGSFDLLITDAVMPSITGAELARRIRASHPGLKVLFISGYTSEPPEREETGGESAAFLQKPFSADSLGRKIRQILGRA